MSDSGHRRVTPLISPEALVRRPGAPARSRKEERADALLADSLGAPEAEHLPPLEDAYEAPRIVKAVTLSPTRRQFVASAAAAAGLACSEMEIIAKDGVCSCHAVCTCDTVGSNEERDATFETRTDGGDCTCDVVCTCNTVCTCESVGGGDSGGYSYSYTYYY